MGRRSQYQQQQRDVVPLKQCLCRERAMCVTGHGHPRAQQLPYQQLSIPSLSSALRLPHTGARPEPQQPYVLPAHLWAH